MAMGDRVVLARTLVRIDDQRLKQTIAGRDIEKAVQDDLFKLGQQARDMARRLAPVDTGALKASIYVARDIQSEADEAKLGKSPFNKRSTQGYFRAMNAAVNLNPKVELFPEGSGLVEHKTQRPTAAGAGAFDRSVSTIKGSSYITYGKEGILPTIMEKGYAGRASAFITIGAGVFYAGYVEFGHGRVAAQPFLGPAMAWVQQRYVHVVDTAIARAINR